MYSRPRLSLGQIIYEGSITEEFADKVLCYIAESWLKYLKVCDLKKLYQIRLVPRGEDE